MLADPDNLKPEPSLASALQPAADGTSCSPLLAEPLRMLDSEIQTMLQRIEQFEAADNDDAAAGYWLCF